MIRTAARLGLLGVITIASPNLLAPAGAADPALVTSYQVLVGFPLGQEAASAGVLLVPGTVIPIEAAAPAPGGTEEQAIVGETLAFARVVDKLWRTFRLDPLRKVQYGRYVDATVGRGVELPAPSDSDVHLTAELVGFSESVATYRVMFEQGDQVLADSTVNVERGGRAVVGGMDGESAPYIFVVVEPDPPQSRPIPFDQQAGITEPVKVKHVNPVYPKSAKEDGVQGLVVLQAALDKQGYPQNVRVLHSPDPRLSEAAVETARQWRWEPARTPDGQPIAVYFTLTFNFRLE